MKQTENIRRHLGESLTIKWGTSRGRDTYGYTTCTLRNKRGDKVAGCNGGGYDMRGTVIGNWVAATFPNELLALKPEDMPANSHWQPERARQCAGKCRDEWQEAHTKAIIEEKPEPAELPKLSEDTWECPACGGSTHASRDGKTVDDGRYFYGLRFYDPHFDVLNAKLERADEIFTKAEDVGKTFRELQKEGKIVDLDVLRSWYKQTSPHATERHTVPTIDGACGVSSVMNILNAIGLTLDKVHDSKKLDIYIIREHVSQQKENAA